MAGISQTVSPVISSSFYSKIVFSIYTKGPQNKDQNESLIIDVKSYD